ncbi:MAG: DNA primase DnaG [Candidatus Micrarchaeia archaeon]
MGKTYLDTVKYMIRSTIEVDGIVEKPDLVGAVFGQTEGLLGDDLDLRELQKNGRIGRIEVDLHNKQGKSEGTILIPSSLDMVETSILAAALEIVDRVGPCEARIVVNRIEDIRNVKRKKVLDRARNLLRSLLTEEIPESKELTELVREDVKVEEITTYGPEKLPCGPEMATSNEIIFVEGRADVVNLLRNSINNTVAIGGANVGPTIIKLGKEKEVTVFLDGDRGGDIILKELLAQTDIDFVARAPAGKEVEELTRKELIKCLRRRVPVEQAEAGSYNKPDRDEDDSTPNMHAYDRSKHMQFSQDRRSERPQERSLERSQLGNRPARPQFDSHARQPFEQPSQARQQPEQAGIVNAESADTQQEPEAHPVQQEPAAPSSPQEAKVKAVLKELEGSLKAKLLDAEFNTTAEIPIREIMKALSDTTGVHAIVLDGIITQRLVDLAEQKGAEYVVGVRAGNISRKPQNVNIVLANP